MRKLCTYLVPQAKRNQVSALSRNFSLPSRTRSPSSVAYSLSLRKATLSHSLTLRNGRPPPEKISSPSKIFPRQLYCSFSFLCLSFWICLPNHLCHSHLFFCLCPPFSTLLLLQPPFSASLLLPPPFLPHSFCSFKKRG